MPITVPSNLVLLLLATPSHTRTDDKWQSAGSRVKGGGNHAHRLLAVYHLFTARQLLIDFYRLGEFLVSFHSSLALLWIL